MKTISINISLVIIILISAILTIVENNLFFKKKPYNILIISTCSLSVNRMPVWGNEELANMPYLKSFLENATIFKNAFSDMSWSNVSGFLSELSVEELEKNHYKAIGGKWTQEELDWQKIKNKNIPEYYYRFPNADRFTRGEKTNYNEDLKKIKSKLLDRKNWPFLVEIHNKIIHLPYVKKTANLDFSENEKNYLKDAVNNLDMHPERILFTMFYAGKDIDYLKKVNKLLKTNMALLNEDGSVRQPLFVGHINNSVLLKRWQASSFYKEDLRLIKKMYNKQLENYDKTFLSKVLKLYGDKEAQENTVIIFTGDHGEAFGEHGYMIHGETEYDEMIQFPFAVKFPGQEKPELISEQFHQMGVLEVVRGILTGKLNEKNIKEKIIGDNKYKYIYSRNCSYTSRSLRFDNKWKYIENFQDDTRELYKLDEDPKEKNNVFDVFPEIAGELESQIEIQKNAQKMNKMIHTCVEL